MRGYEVLVGEVEIRATGKQTINISYSLVKLIAPNWKQLRNVVVINTMSPSIT
jgi:hypothetical protein